MQMSNYLITGVAGFIGSNLAEKLIADGNVVLGVDNLLTGKKKNLNDLLENKNFHYIEADILEYDFANLEFAPEYIFHLASPASPPKYFEYPLETIHVNTVGTEILLNYSARVGAKILFASTSEVYGDPQVHPQPEIYWGNVNPIGPRSVYDEAKRLGETLMFHYHRKGLANTTVVRIFNTYGPKMDPYDGRVVTNLLRQAIQSEPLTLYGSGDQTRSFCYISDLVIGLIAAMDADHPGPINLGNPNEVSLLSLVKKAEVLVGEKCNVTYSPLPEDDPTRRRPDIDLARSILRWEPSINLEIGLALTYSWLKDNL